MTFGKWPEEIHSTIDQKNRIESAKAAKTTPSSIDKHNEAGVFPGSGSAPYQTTLDDCTCVDFSRRSLPCKHIYRLAIELGLLHEKAKSGINKNVIASSQISLADAVHEIENLSDDCQLFIMNLPHTEPVIFPVAKNDKELMSCTVLATCPLEPENALENMSKMEVVAMLRDNGYTPPKNMLKDSLIPWCIENIEDLNPALPEIVYLSASPLAKKIWNKLHMYLRRKYGWDRRYLESESLGIREFFIPAGAEKAFSVQQGPVFYFPDDEITELLTLFGHNRCLNGFVLDMQNTLSIEKSEQFHRKRFAITGAFKDMTRAEISAIILNRGGSVNEWVTKNTDYLVAGNNAGSKLQRAKEKGVPVLSMQDFFALMDEN